MVHVKEDDHRHYRNEYRDLTRNRYRLHKSADKVNLWLERMAIKIFVRNDSRILHSPFVVQHLSAEQRQAILQSRRLAHHFPSGPDSVSPRNLLRNRTFLASRRKWSFLKVEIVCRMAYYRTIKQSNRYTINSYDLHAL